MFEHIFPKQGEYLSGIVKMTNQRPINTKEYDDRGLINWSSTRQHKPMGRNFPALCASACKKEILKRKQPQTKVDLQSLKLFYRLSCLSHNQAKNGLGQTSRNSAGTQGHQLLRLSEVSIQISQDNMKGSQCHLRPGLPSKPPYLFPSHNSAHPTPPHPTHLDR